MSDKKDLTRIEDLSEFLHQNNDELDALLDEGPPPMPTSLDELEDGPPSLEDVEEFPYQQNNDDEDSFQDDSATEEDSEEFSFNEDAQEEDNSFDLESEDDFSFDDTETESSFDQDDDSIEEDFETEDFTLETPLDSEEFQDEFDEQPELEDSLDFEELEESEDPPELFEEVEEQAFEEIEETEELEFEEEVQQETQEGFQDAEPEPIFEQPALNVSEPSYSEIKSEVQNFGNNLSANMSIGGTPPFTLVINNINYIEDKEKIKEELEAIGVYKDDTASLYDQSLERGSILLSQLSEYLAIYLCHKFRNLKVSMKMGLSEELHESPHYQSNRGFVSRYTNQSNKKEYNEINQELEIDDVLLSVGHKLDGFKTIKYIGIKSVGVILSESELLGLNEESEYSLHYEALNIKLKAEAIKSHANGVLDVSYRVNPLISKTSKAELGEELLYKITASGNLVNLVKES